MPKHALLSASSSDRWIHCPPSARLSETYEDKGSDYAAEGTDAHSLCEYKLRKALGMEADDPTEHLSWFNQEMDDHATGYAAYVLEQVEAAKETCSDPVVLIEQRVDFSRWVEEGFGTADCIVIADGTLQIIDFKYGLGVLVSAEENPQMMCYALGALELFDDIYDIDAVRMTIYQPRRDNLSTYDLSKEDLYRWADEVLKPAAPLPVTGTSSAVNGAASARPRMPAALAPLPIWSSQGTTSNCRRSSPTRTSRTFSARSTLWWHGHPILRITPCSRRSAERSGRAGSSSKAAPTAGT